MSNQEKPEARNEIKLILAVAFLLLILALSTRYIGGSDVGDYSDTAKFFAGSLNAKLRTSHPVTYGLLHAFPVKLASSFWPFKITTALWLSLLVISVYYMSKRNKKTLWLFIATPALWFMAPWISPVPLAALFFLWAYYFVNKYDKENKLKHLLYSGLLIGMAWNVWEAIIYFALLMIFVFLYNKKTIHFLLFLFAISIGIIPKLIIDYVLFGFPFYSIFKHFFSVIAFSFYGGIYGQEEERTFSILLPTLLIIPIYTIILFTKKNFKQYKREIIFVLLALLATWVAGSQIRYIFVAIPIIILLLGKILTQRQFLIQLVIFFVMSILVINPYLIQIKYDTNAYEYPLIITKIANLTLEKEFANDIIIEDLSKISKDFPSQTFVVGNAPDTYQILASLYWGRAIKEFVSIQDYQLYLKNETIIFERNICSASKYWNRRDICISASLKKPLADSTDYPSIKYGLSLESNLSLENFKLAKQYRIVSVWEKK